eukprot:Gb_34622 [translate_table: standard]
MIRSNPMDTEKDKIKTPGSDLIADGAKEKDREEKSWYIFTILTRIGRPSFPEEISEKCSLYSITPLEVESLCVLPGSPLRITEDRLVTCSAFSVSLLENLYGKSLSDSNKDEKNELPFKSPRKRLGEELVVDTSFRKTNKTPKLEACPPIESCEQPETPSCRGQGCFKHPQNAVAKGSIQGQLNGFDGNMNRQSVLDPVCENDCNATHSKLPRILDSMKYGIASVTEIAGDGTVLGNSRENNPFPLETVVMTRPDTEMCNLLDVSTVSNPECLVHSCHKTKDILSNANNLNNIGVAEMKEADINMQPTNIKIENCLIPSEYVQIPQNHGDNCVKDDCVLKYKRRKGEMCKNQPGCMDNEGMPNPDICKVTQESYLPTQPAQTIGKYDGTQTTEPEGAVLRTDHAILVEDTLVSLQACASSTEVNLAAKKECPAQAHPVECQIAGAAREKSVIKNNVKEVSALKPELLCKQLGACLTSNLSKPGNACTSLEKMSNAKRKAKKCGKAHAVAKDETDTACPFTTKNGMESKRIPLFESFTVEEEEGSGGYGTVYKARRKEDGKVFAIKFLRGMSYVRRDFKHGLLQVLSKRLPPTIGKHYIIKYEGVFKHNDCDCLILQHVEHEKPEILKREIDVPELRWYGYCMFKALQALHKQGIIHRDVKPGNFLFSRKLNKGYLIDFNLALDQFELNARKSKPKILPRVQKSIVPSADQRPPVFTRKGIPDNFRQKALLSAAVNSQTNDATNVTKKARQAYIKPSSTTNLKRAMHPTQVRQHDSNNNRAQGNFPQDTMDPNRKNRLGEQGAAKLSGMHLLSPSKDITSARTPSGGNRKEPLPSQGRKELLNLLQEARQTPPRQATLIPVPQRKRVAAPQDRVGRENGNIIHVSPMPLHSNLNTTAYGFNSIPKNKDNQKCKRDGPCVGTKGYRAPEVLLRSLYQGFKLDIWSAGVSLLYLMVGKTPFQANSTDQAIKDIAKLRGKEEVWEIAKLHDRENSLPEDLYSAVFENISIEEWCKKNTKRPDFLHCIPTSLFDLVNKCLCVNPRQRIDADGALEHEFFAPCHETLKKVRSSSRESVLTELSGQASSSAS